ncbi:MAG: hypothetical protein M0Z90_07910 [Desulfobacteraceae bacterium]|nr:hypothetical protein [Desulfobacteraceae bacterium]
MDKDSRSLEKAAKYICTFLDGLCPMAAEAYPCPQECGLDTIPWECWMFYFNDPGVAARNRLREAGAAA